MSDDIDIGRWIDAQLAADPSELIVDAPDPEHDGWLARGVEPMDCRNRAGLRPCPFVGCRAHLLLDHIETVRPEPNLVLSRARLPMFAPPPVLPGRPDPSLGRRPELTPTVRLGSPEDQAFQRRALERLWELPDTCAREVAARELHHADAIRILTDDHGRGGVPVRSAAAIARITGADEDETADVIDDALCLLRGAAIAEGADPDDPASAWEAMITLLGFER